jgi:hypothetical protein
MLPPRPMRRPSDRSNAFLEHAELLQASDQEAAGGDLLPEQRIAPTAFLGGDQEAGARDLRLQFGDAIAQESALHEQFNAAAIGDEVLTLDRVPEFLSRLADRTWRWGRLGCGDNRER